MNSTWVNCQLQLSIYVISISFLDALANAACDDSWNIKLYRFQSPLATVLYYGLARDDLPSLKDLYGESQALLDDLRHIANKQASTTEQNHAT